jgi:hypothetical protein
MGKPDFTRITIASLERDTGSRREDIIRWLKDEGFDHLNLPIDGSERYYEIIAAHQAKKGASSSGSGVQTELEKKQIQETRKLKRENDIAEKALSGDWMMTSAHHAILSNLCAKLETVPDTVKTELGLSVSQRDRVRNILDQARKDAAADTERALKEQEKQFKKEATA